MWVSPPYLQDEWVFPMRESPSYLNKCCLYGNKSFKCERDLEIWMSPLKVSECSLCECILCEWVLYIWINPLYVSESSRCDFCHVSEWFICEWILDSWAHRAEANLWAFICCCVIPTESAPNPCCSCMYAYMYIWQSKCAYMYLLMYILRSELLA